MRQALYQSSPRLDTGSSPHRAALAMSVRRRLGAWCRRDAMRQWHWQPAQPTARHCQVYTQLVMTVDDSRRRVDLCRARRNRPQRVHHYQNRDGLPGQAGAREAVDVACGPTGLDITQCMHAPSTASSNSLSRLRRCKMSRIGEMCPQTACVASDAGRVSGWCVVPHDSHWRRVWM